MSYKLENVLITFIPIAVVYCHEYRGVFISLQGLRIGGALSMSHARKVNVEPGCSVPDPCSSSPCPANSYCNDDWDSYSCTCLTGQSACAQTDCTDGQFLEPKAFQFTDFFLAEESAFNIGI